MLADLFPSEEPSHSDDLSLIMVALDSLSHLEPPLLVGARACRMSSSHSAGSLNLSDHCLLFNDNRTASRCLFARSRDCLFDVCLLRCNLIDESMGGPRTPKFVGWREAVGRDRILQTFKSPYVQPRGPPRVFLKVSFFALCPLGVLKCAGLPLRAVTWSASIKSWKCESCEGSDQRAIDNIT
jgi:hypothetical protein